MIDPWAISEDRYISETMPLKETLYAQANGYLGTRGTFEEDVKPHGVEGVYINGFYETQDIHYEESAYGFATTSQTMLNLPNGKIIRVFLGEEEFSMENGTVLSYNRKMDFRKGVLKREIRWRSPTRKEVLIETARLISFTRKHVMAIRYRITPLNRYFPIRIVSCINADVTNISKDDDPRIGSNLSGRSFDIKGKIRDGNTAGMVIETKRSGKQCCIIMHNQMNKYNINMSADTALLPVNDFMVNAKIGEPVELNKTIVYYAEDGINYKELEKRATDILNNAISCGFEKLTLEQEKYLTKFWDNADICIEGADDILQGLRFNTFQLLQNTGKDGKTSVSAKGLSGEGYEGHYFWESETYIMPAFMFTAPEIARSLLMYRYSILDMARENAKVMNHQGAMYAWRTINGYECSAYFPAGAAQYHITGGVSYAIKRYYDSTGDINFIRDYGAEILIETARFWLSAGHFNDRKDGKFCIDGVTGPDEYTAIVNNNCYTNIMASENMLFAADMHDLMKEKFPKQYKKLQKKINIGENEAANFRLAGENIYLPYDEKFGIYMQDDSFLEKKKWDFDSAPKDKYPLLLHYHPLVIYRHQVSKQPDLLLIEFLVRNRFDTAQTKRDYDYYSTVTTHDSSLSESVFAILASMVGDYDKAYQYFVDIVRLDLDNTHNNTEHGLHMANLAGVWGSVIFGFAGVNIKDGTLEFSPHLPDKWKSYTFRLQFQGRKIEVLINKSGAHYTLLKGKPLDIVSNGKKLVLE